ncbi:MAG: hypothetical protein JWP02_3214 [Acidimicrobiales bacterium]|nr:hypothetical protein [Acidimicrobiales bacterium]
MVVVALVVVAAWLVLAALALVRARSDLVAGRAAAAAVRRRPPATLIEGGSVTDLQQALRRFTAARAHLRSPVLLPVRVIPLVGRQVQEADTVSHAAAQIAGIGLDGVRTGRRIVGAPHTEGPQRLQLVEGLAALAESSQRRLARIHLGSSRLLVPQVADARRQLERELVDLRSGVARGAVAARALSGLLTGPRRYLVFAGNNAEMRAGAGMFLSVGEMEAADGHIRLTGMTSVINVPVPPGAVPLTGDMAGRWGWLEPNNDWRNLMLSPRFATSAELASRMWVATGHAPVDGVLVLDPVALQGILEATGPVSVAGRSVGGAQVVTELLHDQYVRFPQLLDRPERRDELAELASAAVSKLESGSWSAAKLGQGLARGARGRHVLAWSSRPDEERAWVAAGVSGTVDSSTLLPAVISRGGNKVDQFLSVRADLHLQPSGDHTDARLELRVHNGIPPGEVQYIAGPHFETGLQEGDYLGIAAFTVPGNASGAQIEGISDLAVAGPDGPTRVVGAELLLPRGADRTFVARFRLPGRHGRLRIESSARVPAVEWTVGRERWMDIGSHLVAW